jgi:hypothetical protein
MKKQLTAVTMILSVIIEVFLIIGVVSPVSVNRRSHNRAIARWMLNRSPANERILKCEFEKTRKAAITAKWLIIALFSFNTAGLIILLTRKGRYVFLKNKE